MLIKGFIKCSVACSSNFYRFSNGWYSCNLTRGKMFKLIANAFIAMQIVFYFISFKFL